MVRFEQRQASRFAVPLALEQAELHWDCADFPARLIDQSAGGFAIQIDSLIGIEENQTAAMTWSGGCCRVRVVSRIDEPNFVRLGLARLNDLDSADDMYPRASIWSSRRPRLPLPQKNWTYFISGSLVVIGCAIAAVAWEALPSQTTVAVHTREGATKEISIDPTMIAHARRQKEGAAKEWGAGTNRLYQLTETKILPKPIRQWIAVRKQVFEQATKGVVQTLLSLPVEAVKQSPVSVQEFAAATVDSIRRAADFGNDSIALAASRFIGMLQLTNQQHKDLNAVLASMRETTQQLYHRSRELGTEQTMREIERVRHEAGEQIRTILTPAQVEELRKLSSKQHSPQREAPPAPEAKQE